MASSHCDMKYLKTLTLPFEAFLFEHVLPGGRIPTSTPSSLVPDLLAVASLAVTENNCKIIIG